MPKNPKQKQKLLYIMKYLQEKTDENFGVTVADIIAYLDSYDIKAERKSIYDDLRTLEDFGLDIGHNKVGKETVWYLSSREFELPELKLLVDAVQSSKFITKNKSAKLIKKLETLASENDAKSLHRQVIVSNRVKTTNEKIYYNIDAINVAINDKKEITFYYTQWAIAKEGTKKIVRERRRDGKLYVVSPKALTWDDENYYLIAFDAEEDKLKHFRVDKMENITVTEIKAKGSKSVDKLDLAVYSKQVFGMYGGKLTSVKIKMDKSLIGVVADRFSDKVFITTGRNNTFTMCTDVMLSPQFFGWLFSLGDKAQIISPKSAKDEYLSYLESVMEKYEN
ncbi:MAG: WYL domain-containing protein [Ruminococcus sp.]|nr:WYL domain-containing protein [Ruminococcus sp.]